MNSQQLIPVTPGRINGQPTQLVDARHLHAYLEVRRDFSTWIKDRVEEFGFEIDRDYLLIPAPPIRGAGNRGKRTDYFLSLDMAKELAMVERTPRGRQARRYFLDCERQLRHLQQVQASALKSPAVELSRAQRQAINRQAWADVAGPVYGEFHARREFLMRLYQEQSKHWSQDGPAFLPEGFRPKWAM
jgi:anti-repressor protein